MRSSDKFAELDSQAFGTLVEPYRRELHLHCYRMLGSVLDAEDLVQETLLRAWRRRDTLENREALRAWLYKIATHVCLDALRKRPRRVVP
ncbi:MAG: sigma-70 family RNA polymerase sigma factor, partial [Anaerolineae bacterium]|nr:sigma-70 family RNA polymerase sigma factor [Anaerolineae bacterium]